MNIIDRARNIIRQPMQEWPVISGEADTARNTIFRYAIPLILIGTIATFLGIAIIGIKIPFVGGRIHSLDWALHQAIMRFLGDILGIIVAGYVIDMLAPSFKSEKELSRSIRLVVFAYTPYWLCGVFNLLPFLGLLVLVGAIYGLVLLYMGLPIMKNTPEEQRVAYFIVSLLVIIAVYVVVAILLGLVLAVFIRNPMSDVMHMGM